MKFLSLLPLALLAGCSASNRYADAEKLVADTLKDPMSAQFSDLSQEGGPGHPVCGFVNSKNGYGAYVGKRAFYVLDGNPKFKDESEAIEFNATANRVCSSEFMLLLSREDLRESEEFLRRVKEQTSK